MFRRHIQNARKLFNTHFGVNIARHCSHKFDGVNNDVLKWTKTLSEIDSKKIRYFVNEVDKFSYVNWLC